MYENSTRNDFEARFDRPSVIPVRLIIGFPLECPLNKSHNGEVNPFSHTRRVEEFYYPIEAVRDWLNQYAQKNGRKLDHNNH